jgi:peptidoglycan/LPS O-acetylase OafA/YrhL
MATLVAGVHLSAPLPVATRYVFLDGVRGIAAMAIVIYHFTAFSGQRTLFASAPIAVDFFFCLSGFVIAHAYHARLLHGMSIATFTKKRLVRLYPMYLAGILLGLVAISWLKTHSLTDLSWLDIEKASLLNLFYLPYFNASYIELFSERVVGAVFPLDNPAWSLFFELILANLLYAVTLRGWRHAAMAWLVVGAIALCVATLAYGEAPGWGSGNFVGGIPRVLYPFFAGVVIHQMRDRLAFLPRVPAGWVVIAIMLVMAMPQIVGHRHYWLASVLFAVPLIVALGSRAAIRDGSFAQRACTYAGQLSYPIYCIHYPLLMILSTFGSLFTSRAPLFILFLVLAVGLSHLLLRYVDEPIRSWLTLKLRA